MSKFQPSKFQIGALSCLVAFLVLLAAGNVSAINFVEQLNEQQQQQASGKSTTSLAVIENPEMVVRVLDNLIRSVMYSLNVEVQSNQAAQKRGLDLGMTRGFSGSQAGKHLMGLSAASFANGPGRR